MANKAITSRDIDFAKCAVDEFITNGVVDRIRFFADGEPTTEFELMKEIYEYALKYGAINIRILTYHPDYEEKILGFIGSKLFDKNIEAEFDLDVFQTMQDKKVLSYVLNCMYEEGILKFKDSLSDGDKFDYFEHLWADYINKDYL